jgi:acetyl-CoA acetyltransferase
VLAGERPDDLAAAVLKAVLHDVPSLDPGRVDEVVWGNANGAGEENRNVGRMAALLAGLPVSVPGTTVNRLCGSSLGAAMIGSRQIETGDASVVVGGVESMTRAPWVLPKPDRAFPAGNATAVSTTLGWRLVNPAMPAEWTVSHFRRWGMADALRENDPVPEDIQRDVSFVTRLNGHLILNLPRSYEWSEPLPFASEVVPTQVVVAELAHHVTPTPMVFLTVERQHSSAIQA